MNTFPDPIRQLGALHDSLMQMDAVCNDAFDWLTYCTRHLPAGVDAAELRYHQVTGIYLGIARTVKRHADAITAERRRLRQCTICDDPACTRPVENLAACYSPKASELEWCPF